MVYNCIPQFYYIKVGYKGYSLHGHVFPMHSFKGIMSCNKGEPYTMIQNTFAGKKSSHSLVCLCYCKIEISSVQALLGCHVFSLSKMNTHKLSIVLVKIQEATTEKIVDWEIKAPKWTYIHAKFYILVCQPTYCLIHFNMSEIILKGMIK